MGTQPAAAFCNEEIRKIAGWAPRARAGDTVGEGNDGNGILVQGNFIFDFAENEEVFHLQHVLVNPLGGCMPPDSDRIILCARIILRAGPR